MKIKFLAVLSLGALALASCKKDRTCECKYTEGSDVSITVSGTYKKVTKRLMRNVEDCVSYEYVSTDGDVEIVECEIK